MTGGSSRSSRRLDLDRHVAEDHGDRAALHVEVGAETRHARDAEGEVDLARGLELLALGRRQDLLGHGDHVLHRRRRQLHVDQIAVDPQDGRRGDLQVQVARAARDHLVEDTLDVREPRRRSLFAETPAVPVVIGRGGANLSDQRQRAGVDAAGAPAESGGIDEEQQRLGLHRRALRRPGSRGRCRRTRPRSRSSPSSPR